MPYSIDGGTPSNQPAAQMNVHTGVRFQVVFEVVGDDGAGGSLAVLSDQYEMATPPEVVLDSQRLEITAAELTPSTTTGGFDSATLVFGGTAQVCGDHTLHIFKSGEVAPLGIVQVHSGVQPQPQPAQPGLPPPPQPPAQPQPTQPQPLPQPPAPPTPLSKGGKIVAWGLIIVVGLTAAYLLAQLFGSFNWGVVNMGTAATDQEKRDLVVDRAKYVVTNKLDAKEKEKADAEEARDKAVEAKDKAEAENERLKKELKAAKKAAKVP